jgi:unsaturated chondroitin disaccharide hydrolase
MKIFTTPAAILFLIISFPYAQNKPDIDKAVTFSLKQLTKSINEVPEGSYPIRTKGIGKWELVPASNWTSGFFPGCLWYGYELSGDSHHDTGFMIYDSFGNGYRLTGNEKYKPVILQTAKSLASLYNEKVGCIQSWPGDFQVIVDNMMNLELLFWSAKNGGEKSHYDIAVSHAYKTIENHLREDGSAFHVVHYNPETGEVVKKRTHQGYADSSAWARGQAWGIYGFTMCYRETGDTNLLNTAEKMAKYFIDNLPEDYVPYWDFCLPENYEKRYKDASAAAIALSAFLELRNYVDNSAEYDSVINGMMNSLINNYMAEGTESSGIINHTAYNVNNENVYDWDASTIWGDYYFLESLIRYRQMSEAQ